MSLETAQTLKFIQIVLGNVENQICGNIRNTKSKVGRLAGTYVTMTNTIVITGHGRYS